MSNEARLLLLLKEIGIPYNARTEGDGSTTIQVGDTQFVFNKYGRYQHMKGFL